SGMGDDAPWAGCGTRAAAGRDDAAVAPPRALSQLGHPAPRARGAPDQALDLLRAAAGPATLAAHAGVRGARQHAVLRGDPALALPLEERRHLVLDGRGTDHLRVAELHEHRALGVTEIVAGEPDRAQLVRGPPVVARAHRRVAALRGGGDGAVTTR